MPLMPKRYKHRKVQRGSRKGNATSGNKVSYGAYGLQTLDRAWLTKKMEVKRREFVKWDDLKPPVWFPNNGEMILDYSTLPGVFERISYLCKVFSKEQDLPFVFAGPSGLDLGGTLPESIALSILAECHARCSRL